MAHENLSSPIMCTAVGQLIPCPVRNDLSHTQRKILKVHPAFSLVFNKFMLT